MWAMSAALDLSSARRRAGRWSTQNEFQEGRVDYQTALGSAKEKNFFQRLGLLTQRSPQPFG